MLRVRKSLRWRHNDHDGVSNHQPHHGLLNCLFGRSSKKTSKLIVTGFCEENSPVTGEFHTQRASYGENFPFGDVIMLQTCRFHKVLEYWCCGSGNDTTLGIGVIHDDVIKWKHYPRNWPFVRGIHRSREFPAERPVTRSFDAFFDLRPNKRLSKQPWGWWFETQSWSWWRHCNVEACAKWTPFCRRYFHITCIFLNDMFYIWIQYWIWFPGVQWTVSID